MFAREAASSQGSSTTTIPATQNPADGPVSSDHSTVVTGALEPSVMMSPERKRPYSMDHSDSALNFSDGDLDDTLHAPKKSKNGESETPAPIPDLPRVSEDMVRHYSLSP